jgi:hypothetical protein
MEKAPRIKRARIKPIGLSAIAQNTQSAIAPLSNGTSGEGGSSSTLNGTDFGWRHEAKKAPETLIIPGAGWFKFF